MTGSNEIHSEMMKHTLEMQKKLTLPVTASLGFNWCCAVSVTWARTSLWEPQFIFKVR